MHPYFNSPFTLLSKQEESNLQYYPNPQYCAKAAAPLGFAPICQLLPDWLRGYALYRVVFHTRLRRSHDRQPPIPVRTAQRKGQDSNLQYKYVYLRLASLTFTSNRKRSCLLFQRLTNFATSPFSRLCAVC
jgi:hypothetical protein